MPSPQIKKACKALSGGTAQHEEYQMTRIMISGLAVAVLLGVAGGAVAQVSRAYGPPRASDYVAQPSITLFERPGFQGKSRRWTGDVSDLGDKDFNDHAASAQVQGRWRVCGDADMRGRCQEIARDIPDLKAIGLDHQISSFAYVGPRPEPIPVRSPPTSPPPSFDRDDALQGRTAALFRRPVTGYGPVPSRQAEADDYCRAMGYAISIYADYSGSDLRDLVCRR